MAIAINVPRVNNNDDEVKLVSLSAAVGSLVAAGDVIAEVETDKAVVEVEAHAGGYVLAVLGQVDEQLRVGSVLLWLGETADEEVPKSSARDQRAAHGSAASGAAAPTAKANILLRQHGLQAEQVAASGERLSAADVQRYLDAQQGGKNRAAAAPTARREVSAASMTVPGEVQALASHEKGMLSTVTWHRDHAVPGYIEISYEQAPWLAAAKAHQAETGALFSPLLPLMGARLVEIAKDHPKINATMVDSGRYHYAQVNLGFTVQVAEVLYLTVVQAAEQKNKQQLVTELVELQRLASGHKLAPQQCTGATLSFSSMARWKVGRHIPVLSPFTSLMIAHTAVDDQTGILGATYDHRVLSGADVVKVLKLLSRPA
ncbi:2-oxo acid dehydrogenase subunit E2 [Paucibacter sp. Y2R2-4]|uniref:2-oxo acid dehydrogenase subunit E2 n=1 Tax=Paucibacter sp. Y2R2-4 TaxID=2893553 RepID=UPI0021E42163|nr:2-oxo acid dehydrogenase subunit E2 [Paucibacter sp. Y2R2-4]MCV2348547.1 2-oxo acid dehydrogenase subunit E2 [Paucibacter sp. Y2R2-4]